MEFPVFPPHQQGSHQERGHLCRKCSTAMCCGAGRVNHQQGSPWTTVSLWSAHPLPSTVLQHPGAQQGCSQPPQHCILQHPWEIFPFHHENNPVVKTNSKDIQALT